MWSQPCALLVDRGNEERTLRLKEGLKKKEPYKPSKRVG